MGVCRTHLCALVLVALSLPFTSCSADISPSEQASPSSTVLTIPALPDGGIALSDLGIRNGPVGFSVPEDLHIFDLIDQLGVVTFVMTPEEGQHLMDYLLANLETMGFQIQGQATDALYFIAPEWEGACVLGTDQAGFTLRAHPGSFITPTP